MFGSRSWSSSSSVQTSIRFSGSHSCRTPGYDICAETATQLSARYVRLSDDTTNENEWRDWWNKVVYLRDEKNAVDAHDRATMIAKITAWTTAIRELGEQRRG
ncbi:hypothetical protein [Streptomyces sp. NK08204]|uniref:hypothetical protein n=1 Tax=Streptomyces sp. NK08204 TaxID=2873260 RepID=UPI001CED96CD|nr:hypothetical protein [Streptomyces sp. NK08204]